MEQKNHFEIPKTHGQTQVGKSAVEFQSQGICLLRLSYWIWVLEVATYDVSNYF